MFIYKSNDDRSTAKATTTNNLCMDKERNKSFNTFVLEKKEERGIFVLSESEQKTKQGMND